MDIESQLLKEYKDFILSKTSYSNTLILPSTPQSFSTFPTIIFKEADNVDSLDGNTLNSQEYIDNLTYQVEIYSKNIGKTSSRTIYKELEFLTHDFFRQVGFNRTGSAKGEYLDIAVDRYILLFNGKLNNWNKKII